jgi:hypothetical protein
MSSSASTSSHDVQDIEKKALDSNAIPTGSDVATGNVTSSNAAYDRYLELHSKFVGPARAKFIRKRQSLNLFTQQPIIRRKLTFGHIVDWRLLPTLSFLYLMCSLDKSNAGNAKLFGLLEDIGMTSTQFNVSYSFSDIILEENWKGS